MATKRIKDLTTTASSMANDDYMVIDGETNGTRKYLASDLGVLYINVNDHAYPIISITKATVDNVSGINVHYDDGTVDGVTLFFADGAGLSTVKTAIEAEIPAITALTLTLVVANWSSDAQTLTATGVTASSNVVISPAPASMDDYVSAGIKCTAQSANSLTFTCDTVPTNDISVNVLSFS